MIVTLTINPAIDRILSVDRLAFEDRSYVNSTRESAGGRGINASAVLHSFGAETTAVFPSGGASGKRLESLLSDCGFLIAVVPIHNPIRTNLTVTDKHGLTVNLNETGPAFNKAEVTRVERVVKERLEHATWLMVCGSLPPGVPSSLYARLIAMAREKKVKTLLHADGQALREGIEAKPTVVTPNQQEAERLLGRTLLTRTHGLEAAELIRHMGPEIGGVVPGQPRRHRRIRRRPGGSHAAARGRGLPHRRRRCFVGGLRLVHDAQGESGRSSAMGRGGRHGIGAAARNGFRIAGADAGNLPAGGSPPRGIACPIRRTSSTLSYGRREPSRRQWA